ncbi:hypothetical protein ACFQH6_14355 [Halobacteriaceae archaeon GCM10025711]
MQRSGRVGEMLEDERSNGLLAWLLTGFVGLVAAQNLLQGDMLWAGFTAAIAVLALVPPVAYRDPRVMLPWEVLLLAVLPVLGHVFATFILTLKLTAYLSVAALALVVAVELHVFTPVRMTDWFAVLFVVIATMATAGVWAVVQWLSDVYLGTAFIVSEAALMWDFVAATAAGLLAGVVFELYFRRRARAEARIPEEAAL